MTTFAKAALAVYRNTPESAGTRRCGFTDQGREIARERTRATVAANVKAAYQEIAPLIRELRNEGLSFGAVAKVLNLNGHVTRRGAQWTAVQVRRVLGRDLA